MDSAEMAFHVEFPKEDKICQGEEIFTVTYQGETRKIRAHNYDEIYAIPGLYEYLFYENYKCKSPEVICGLLETELKKSDTAPEDLTVLDVGAGNGMVGEQLTGLGVSNVVGIDIIPEAAEATERDRPGIYKDYYIEDLTRLPKTVYREIEEYNPNCMTIVAALGFDDIPPLAFAEAFNMVDNPGWIAFNIKDAFYCENDCSGFAQLIDKMIDNGTMTVRTKHRYRHRLCGDGTPLHYYAIVGEKQDDIPDTLLQPFS